MLSYLLEIKKIKQYLSNKQIEQPQIIKIRLICEKICVIINSIYRQVLTNEKHKWAAL